MKQLIAVIVLAVFTTSCGPSKEDIKKARMAQAKLNQEIKEMQRLLPENGK